MGEGKALRESADKKEDIVKGSYLSARELAQERRLSQKEELILGIVDSAAKANDQGTKRGRVSETNTEFNLTKEAGGPNEGSTDHQTITSL